MIVQETYAPGMAVSPAARRYGIAPNQLFTGRGLHASGTLSAVEAGEEVVAALEYGCCARPCRGGTTRREGDHRRARGGARTSSVNAG